MGMRESCKKTERGKAINRKGGRNQRAFEREFMRGKLREFNIISPTFSNYLSLFMGCSNLSN